MLLTANLKGYSVIIAGDFSVHVAEEEETLGKVDWLNKMGIVSDFIICSSQKPIVFGTYHISWKNSINK